MITFHGDKHMWHDCLTYVTCRILTCVLLLGITRYHSLSLAITRYHSLSPWNVPSVVHPYVLFLRVTWLIRICDRTPLHTWHVAFLHVCYRSVSLWNVPSVCLILTCDMTHSTRTVRNSWCDVTHIFMCDMTHIHNCDMTHIHMCDMTHIHIHRRYVRMSRCVTCFAFTRVTWLIPPHSVERLACPSLMPTPAPRTIMWAKEPYPPSKEPYVPWKERYVPIFYHWCRRPRHLQLCEQKSPILYQKNPMFHQKSPIFLYSITDVDAPATHNYVSTQWLPCTPSKESYIPSKEPYFLSKELYLKSNEPSTRSRQPYTRWNKPYILSKEPCDIYEKSPLFCKESPTLIWAQCIHNATWQYMYTRTNAIAHILTQKHTHTQTDAPECVLARTYTCTYVHWCSLFLLLSVSLSVSPSSAHIHSLAHPHPHTHTHTRAHIHTHTHTNAHVHTHNLRSQLQLSGKVEGRHEGSDGAYREETAVKYRVAKTHRMP